MTSSSASRNWFEQGGQDYARYRPQYSAALASSLAGLVADRRCALDVGCGNGQLACLLADYFSSVQALDPSQDQLAHARAHSRVTYLAARAEALPLSDASVSLITAAQAAHWFDLPRFYEEVRRVSVVGGVLALVSYGVLSLGPELDERFQTFYTREIGPYWPAERALVDAGYATLPFPFDSLPAPALDIRLEWSLPAFLGYVQTWSAVRRAREAGAGARVEAFAHDLAHAWGDPATTRTVVWPVNLRIGRVRPT